MRGWQRCTWAALAGFISISGCAHRSGSFVATEPPPQQQFGPIDFSRLPPISDLAAPLVLTTKAVQPSLYDQYADMCRAMAPESRGLVIWGRSWEEYSREFMNDAPRPDQS